MTLLGTLYLDPAPEIIYYLQDVLHHEFVSLKNAVLSRPLPKLIPLPGRYFHIIDYHMRLVGTYALAGGNQRGDDQQWCVWSACDLQIRSQSIETITKTTQSRMYHGISDDLNRVNCYTITRARPRSSLNAAGFTYGNGGYLHPRHL